MATASPTLASLRAQVQAIRKKAPNASAFGIFSPSRWTGPARDGDGDKQLAIFQCDSPLQMRLALQSVPPSASAVLVTPLDQGKISDDILVRLAMRKFYAINSWEIVRSLFNARNLDPRITRHPFLAEMLLEDVALQDLQPVSGGFLDADTVWGLLLMQRLGLSGAHPDTAELLRAAAEADLAGRWKACSIGFRAAATTWISETAGDTAVAVLGCLGSEHGAEALAIGLAMGVVYHEGVGHELDKAAGRLEGYVGTTQLATAVARRWRDAAVVAARQVAKPALRRSMDEAEAILEQVGANQSAWHSSELDNGLEQRLSRFGQALAKHVDARASSLSSELQALYASVLQHRLAREGGRRLERCTMALRLARWLADRDVTRTPANASLAAMARQYAADGGFVDWARQVLRGGEPNQDLAGAFVCLVDRMTELRETENKRFATAVADERAAGAVADGVVPVEQILDAVVGPVARQVPVLLLLVDGMSWAVFRELLADITSHDWIEVGLSAVPRRLTGLAVLPSVTEVCRTSLFCGTLRRGQAYDETQGLATHPALAAASQPGFAPRLFHKAALEGDEDSSLAGDIRRALAERKQRVVGIVINAVDDHLDKGDQIDAVWTRQHIRVLEPILAEARSAGRLVVLLSDHGHVLDRQSVGREPTDGLRWRRPGGALADGELEIASPRVVLPEGGRVVVPWTERLRYGSKKNGYHGGATPQEMLIPIGLLWPERQPPDGWTELPPDVPAWWTEPAVDHPAVSVAEPDTVSLPRKAEPATLFDPPKMVPPANVATEPWIEGLLKSEVFTVQKRLAGRVRVDEALLQRLLATLAGRGGSMTAPALAGAVGVPEHRLVGLLAVMQRLLNVEGYPILDRQEAANTVVLNIALLKKQFELPEQGRSTS